MRIRHAAARAALTFVAACGHSGGQATGDAPGAGDGHVDALPMTGAFCAVGSNGAAQGSATVTFDIDVGAGPTQQAFGGGAAVVQPAPIAVSPYIYGINQYPENNYLLKYPHTQFGLFRYGGDSYTPWNWTNNADNNGNDNGYTNTDQFLPYAYGNDPSDPTYPGDPHDTHPAGAVVDGADSVPAAQQRGMATLVSVSVADYVAATATERVAQYAPSADFVSNAPSAAAGSAAVYQDGFVQLMSSHYSAAPVFYSLDNEPNYWKSTHPEVFGTKDLAFDELVRRDAATAAAIKAVAPSAKVFGPVVAGLDGMTSLDDYGDLAASNPYVTSGTDAITYYLAAMHAKETSGGARLLDVLDVHYYNDALGKAGTPKGDADCAQGPRDYWDPAYQTPDTAYDDYIQGWKPRVLIPRLQHAIATSYPGTGLAFSEYNNGCEHSIGGGVAQADVLGVFGAYGVFAATAWPLQTVAAGTNWLVAAFAAYRDYDGAGATVGELALGAVTSDPVGTSVYAFAHPGAAGVEVVGINKGTAPVTVAIRLSNACPLATATAAQLTAAKAALVPVSPAPAVASNALTVTLPAMSVTTFALR